MFPVGVGCGSPTQATHLTDHSVYVWVIRRCACGRLQLMQPFGAASVGVKRDLSVAPANESVIHVWLGVCQLYRCHHTGWYVSSQRDNMTVSSYLYEDKAWKNAHSGLFYVYEYLLLVLLGLLTKTCHTIQVLDIG